MIQLVRLVVFFGITAMLGACAVDDRANAVILPSSTSSDLLGECPSDAPFAGGKAWRPVWSDIDEVETALPAALAKSPFAKLPQSKDFPDGWKRQYVGLVCGHSRLIYGNFFPDRDLNGISWRNNLHQTLDGGAAYFSVIYDVGTKQITRLTFNGEA